MDRVAVSKALHALLPILLYADQRPLEIAELHEVYRLLKILRTSVVSIPGFHPRLKEFISSVQSCSLFEEPPRAPQDLQGLRRRIEELCGLL